MRELQFVEPGVIQWREVPEPALGSLVAALVRPVAVASCDLDRPIAGGDFPLPGPFALGHEFVAEVVEVGDAVTTVRPGDRVSVSFQITCSQCLPCRQGLTGRCGSVPAGSSYGLGPLGGTRWGGALADLVQVPYADAMCVPLPSAVSSAAAASLSDNLPDAWRTVGPYLAPGGRGAADPRVLVFGRASIGLYATGIARALGAAVTYVDTDEANCAVAEKLGATVLAEPLRERYPSHPVMVHSSSTQAGLRTAVRSTSSGGVCTDVGIFLENDVPLPLLEMYTKGLTFVTGRVDARAAMPAVLDLITAGRLDPTLVTSQTADWEDAPAAWASQRGKLVLAR